jgi:hypothetical protein
MKDKRKEEENKLVYRSAVPFCPTWLAGIIIMYVVIRGKNRPWEMKTGESTTYPRLRFAQDRSRPGAKALLV